MTQLPVKPIAEKTEHALEHYPPLHYEDYKTFKTNLIEWLLEEGRRPIKGDGYSENTVKQTHYKIEEAFRWVWNETGDYTTTITPEHANEFTTHQMKHYGDDSVYDFIKSIKRFYKYQNHTKGKNYDWEFEHRDELTTSSQNSKTIDYFKREEMHELYNASLSYGSVKSYYNNQMTSEEREQIKTYLSQRFEKPKSEISPDDFSKANSWKVPSIISTTIDIGLRPIEVGRAKIQWVNTRDNEIVIPARESTKNSEPWQCKISTKTADALDHWMKERDQYEKYNDTDALWLTKSGTPYSTDSLNPILNKLLEETDIRPHGRELSWYSIRRGCATMWAADGGLQDAKEQLRHSELKTTIGYTSSPEQKRADMANDLW